jgi:endoglucanase
MLFTHYRANWVPLKVYTGPVHYPGPVVDRPAFDRLMASGDHGITDLVGNAMDNWNAARLQEELAPAIRRARELGLQLYCAEFGCLPTVPRAERLAYYRDLTGVFAANGMAWANWEYKGDFGLFEWHGTAYQGGAPDVELLDALLAKP